MNKIFMAKKKYICGWGSETLKTIPLCILWRKMRIERQRFQIFNTEAFFAIVIDSDKASSRLVTSDFTVFVWLSVEGEWSMSTLSLLTSSPDWSLSSWTILSVSSSFSSRYFSFNFCSSSSRRRVILFASTRV